MIYFVRLFFFSFLFVTSSVAFADGGKVTGHTGESFIENGGSVRAIEGSSVIYPGDTIRTNDTGRVQWKMMDDSSFALLGDSKFKVDEFTTVGSAKAIFSLLKGGFRTVTGLISKRAGDEYRVETPVATLGVRGTIFTAVFCKGGCDKYIASKTERAKVQDGLYVKVEKGSVSIKNGKGSIVVNEGQVGFSASDGSAPGLADAQAAAFINSPKFNAELPLPNIVGAPSIATPDASAAARVGADTSPPPPPVPSPS